MESQSPTPRLLDQVRSFMRLHYSIHTERTDRQTALRQRIANPGSRPAARQRIGLSDETGHVFHRYIPRSELKSLLDDSVPPPAPSTTTPSDSQS